MTLQKAGKINAYLINQNLNFELIAIKGRLTVFRFYYEEAAAINFVVVHLSSKYGTDAKEPIIKFGEAEECRLFIEELEEKAQTDKTIVVGDFNMNPFDDGMFNAIGFNATLSKPKALKNFRTFRKIKDGTQYKIKYFYNPFWSLMGDWRSISAGTYFYKQASYAHHVWHNFDQLILRPSLLPFFLEYSLEIVTNTGKKSLLNSKGIPRPKFSDHLPIFFSYLYLKNHEQCPERFRKRFVGRSRSNKC